MNIGEAKDQLKLMAKGDYHTVTYEFGDFGDGHTEQKCSVYINGQNFHIDKTWEEALDSMYDALNPKERIEPVIETFEDL